MNTLKVGGGGMAKACGGARWIEWTRERTGKWWLQPARSQYKQFCKRRKIKHERQKARIDPECAPTYGRYMGYDD